MNAVNGEENLLLGVLAYRDGAIDCQKLDYVCRLWGVRRTDVADILEERSWIDEGKRLQLEAAVKRLLELHSGNATLALRSALDQEAEQVLRAIDHPSVRAAMSGLDSSHPSQDLDQPSKNGGTPARPLPSMVVPGSSVRAPAPARYNWRPVLRRSLAGCGVLILAGLIGGVVWLNHERNRERDGRTAAEGGLTLSLDTLSAQVRHLAEEPMTLAEKRSPLRRSLLETDRELFERIAKAPGNSPTARANRGRAYTGMARIDTGLGAAGFGTAFAHQAVEALQALCRDFPNEPTYQADLATALAALARSAERAGLRDEAAAAFGAARVHYERLVNSFRDRADYRREFAEMLVQLGEFHRNHFEWMHARAAYLPARALLEQLLADVPGALALEAELALTLRGLYSTNNNMGDSGGAQEPLQKCIALTRRLNVRHPDVPEVQFIWARVLWSLSNGSMGQFDFSQKAVYPRALLALAGGAGAPNLGLFCAREFVLFHAPRMKQAAAESRQSLVQALSIAQKLAKDEPQTAAYSELEAELMVAVATHEAQVGDHRQAARRLDEVTSRTQEGMVMFNAALAFGRCGAVADPRVPPAEWTKLQEHYGERAVSLLRKARVAGFPYNTQGLKRADETAWLSSRDDFQKLDQLPER